MVDTKSAAGGMARGVKHAGMAALLRGWRDAFTAGGGARLPSVASLNLSADAIADWVFTFELTDLAPLRLTRTHVGRALRAMAALTVEVKPVLELGDGEDLSAGESASFRRCLRRRAPAYEYMRITTGGGYTTTMDRLLLPCQDDRGGAHQLAGMLYFGSHPDARPRSSELDDMSDAALDALPFGVIKLDATGRVERFSKVEAEQSGYGRDPRGLEFFTSVAPCMNTERIRGRIWQAVHSGVFEAEFNHFGDFNDVDGNLTIRACSSRDRGVWLTISR